MVIRTVPHLQDPHIRDRRKFAEEMLARLALGSGQRISRKISTSRRLDLDVICFSDEKIFRVDAAAPGRRFHTFYLGKVERRNNANLPLLPFSGYNRLGHLVLSQHLPTDVSPHSMADARDKLRMTCHHPIHAQNFTIWSHSMAQVPCSCLGSTCGDVYSRPPCFEFFVMEGHISTIS